MSNIKMCTSGSTVCRCIYNFVKIKFKIITKILITMLWSDWSLLGLDEWRCTGKTKNKQKGQVLWYCPNRGTDFCRMLEQKYFSVTIKFQTMKTFLPQATDKCPARNSSRKEVGRRWQIWSVSYDQVTKYLESYIFFFKKSEEFKEGGYAMRNMLSFS